MSGDQNVWSTQLTKDGVAQPDPPAQGKYFTRLASSSITHWGAPNPHSLSGSAATADEVAEGYAAAELCRVTDKIEQARDEQDLSGAAQAAFGPDSFSGGFSNAQRGAPNCRHYLELQKLVLRAELQDHLSGLIAWPLVGIRSFDFHGPELWQVGRHLRFARINLLCNQALLKKAAESRDALLAELTALFTKGDNAWAEIRAQLKPETLEHWAKYSDLAESNNAANRAEAGWLLGLVMLAVLPSVAAQKQTGTWAAKLASAAPQLLRLAQRLNNGSDSGARE